LYRRLTLCYTKPASLPPIRQNDKPPQTRETLKIGITNAA
jgi:hypothetical protein